MTIQTQDTHSDQRVYFGYNWGNGPMPKPTDSVASVSQVIRAMNGLIQGHRDPSEWTENPDSDIRAGIRHIFEACATQLDIANKAIDAQETLYISTLDGCYPRLYPKETGIYETLSYDDWQTPKEWAAHGIILEVLDSSMTRLNQDGETEYHITALPPKAQRHFRDKTTAYNQQAKG